MGTPEVDNHEPSLSRNTFEGATTNRRVLPSNVEDGNSDTSALPITLCNSDDIVYPATITSDSKDNKIAEL